MGVVDTDKLKKLMGSLEKQYGEGTIFTLDSPKANANIERWSTGIEDLDHILGGGMPAGRIIELYGPESAGKTSLAHHLTSQHRYAMNIPIEGTFDSRRAKTLGNKKGQLIVQRCEYGEQVLESINEFSQTNIPLIVVDSVPAMKSKKEIENDDMEKEGRMALTASMLSQRLPKLVHRCEKSKTTVIFINQLRDKMNAPLFGEKDDTPGGRALKFYASIRMRVSRKKWIEIPNKDPKISKDKKPVGLIMVMKTNKNKTADPFQVCEVPFFFDRGFVSFDDVDEIRKELMLKEREKFKK